ncbi:phosphoglycolate phosphatase [Chitinibacteraceae bacterium HSL-7]
MTITAFAFDLDGTLVDSINDLARAANAARAEMGLYILDEPTVRSYVGDGSMSLVARTLADDMAAEWTGSDEQKRAMALFDTHYRAGLTLSTGFYPEVQETLARLHELGYPLAIVTNKPERYTLPLLRELGVIEHFDAIIGGDTLPEKKPSAAPVLHAARLLGVEPEAMLMVGDSRNDILAADAAGSPSVFVSYGYAHDMSGVEPAHTIHHFSELLEYTEQ